MSQHLGQMTDIDPAECARLETRIQSRLSGRLKDFHLEKQDGGLVLHGRARTYYAKQLAQHAVMQASELPIKANQIEVT